VVVLVIAGQSSSNEQTAHTRAGNTHVGPSASPARTKTPAPRISTAAPPQQRLTQSRAALAIVAGVPVAAVPDARLTPGKAALVGKAAICVTGYSARVRDVPKSEKAAVYARYHVRHVPYAHEVDLLVSLELGGSNAISELWPEPYASPWGARNKDALENKLHGLSTTDRRPPRGHASKPFRSTTHRPSTHRTPPAPLAAASPATRPACP